MRVDVHAHAFPGTYVEALIAGGMSEAAGVADLGAGDSASEVDRRLEAMDAVGIDVQVLSPSSLVPALAGAREAAAAATMLNDCYAEIARRRPDRFAAFAVLPLPHLDVALELLDDALARPGIVGLAVATSIDGVSIADEQFEPLFTALDRRGSMLFIHPSGEAAGSSRVRELGLTWALGAPLEETVCIAHLLARDVPRHFPNLRIVNTHLGGALPMLLERLESQHRRSSAAGSESPAAAARRMWYDSVGHGHAAALIAARLSFGADRLVLGTDYPYVRGEQLRRSVDYLGDAGLDPAEAEAIRDRHAAALLGLAGSPAPDGTAREPAANPEISGD